MGADSEATVALLNNWSERIDSCRSETSTSEPTGTLSSLLEGDSLNGSSQTISMPVDHLEKLLRTCADALQRSRSHTHIRLPRSSSPESKALPRDSVAELQPSKSLTEHPQCMRAETVSHAWPFEHHDFPESEKAVLEDGGIWEKAKLEAKPLLDSVADVWEHNFPDCRHEVNDPAHARCHPLSSRVLRMQCQKDLVLARLRLELSGPKGKNVYQFYPWLSLIGYKLEQIHSLTRSFSEQFRRHPIYLDEGFKVPQSNILVQILRYFFEGPVFYLGRNEEFFIGTMLSFCYKRNVLQSPEHSTDPVLERNFQHLIYALWILNIVQTPQYWLTFTCSWNVVQQRIPLIGPNNSDLRPSNALSQTVENIEESFQQRQPELPKADGENVRCSDLNIQAMRNIGGLKIVWTACDRDHLFLDQENGVLRVSWFNKVLVPEYFKFMPTLGQNDVKHTWELLLGHRKHQHDFTELEKIPLPPELASFNHILSRSARHNPLRRPFKLRTLLTTQPHCVPDLYDKYLPLDSLPLAFPYSYFGAYEDRVRILRHYMDTRKPTGLRNLYHDRRDTLTYYTFWAVLLFGGISVLLALLGLMVGAAQTYAAFKQLEQRNI